jgi:squalene synthase HpnC
MLTADDPMSATIANNEQLLQAGWAALPASYRMPEHTPTLAEAQAYCKHLTETHYENFHVASWFLPKRLRPHFQSIYAYCRISDDLGDEVDNPAQALALLDFWNEQLDDCYRGVARHPVFVALAETIRLCDIPKEPFADLLVAFRQDQIITRYATRSELLSYCRYSANPVGRLVLYACGYRDAERFRLSDATCTALQLANFWQDVREDWQRGRVYIPGEDMQRFNVDEQGIASGVINDSFRKLVREEVSWARELFAEGMPLIGMVDRELALDLDLFSRGGLEILSAIEKQQYDVLRARPAISKSRKASLLLRAVAAKFVPGFGLGQAR